MSWKFFGEWITNKYPPKKTAMLSNEAFNQLCEKDKMILLEEEKQANVFMVSMIFWMMIFITTILTLNWVLV